VTIIVNIEVLIVDFILLFDRMTFVMNRLAARLDVLAIGAHPDDVELASGGTLALLVARGHRVGILDLSRGERGTRGDAETRDRESGAAAVRLKLAWRGNAGFPDGGLEPTPVFREKLAVWIRRLRPEVVIAVATDRRHPDHTAAETLAHDACFVAGLRGDPAARPKQRPYRPRKFLRAVGFRGDPPNLVVDVTSAFGDKLRAIRCYRSQFAPGQWDVLRWVEARARYFGSLVRVRFGEAFIQREPVLLDDLTRLPGSSF
jgi:bacillithiol biosynthesis deacetylase BshB1